jgi:hypothetical protein
MRLEIISQMVMRSIASDNHIEVVRKGIHKSTMACLPLVTARNYVLVDPDLLQCDEVWAAAGTWNDNFGAAPADIVRVAGGVVTDLQRA